jgi:hypothetical protein
VAKFRGLGAEFHPFLPLTAGHNFRVSPAQGRAFLAALYGDALRLCGRYHVSWFESLIIAVHAVPEAPFRDKCAIVTSYNPLAKDITLAETEAYPETAREFIYNTYTELLEDVEAKPLSS